MKMTDVAIKRPVFITMIAAAMMVMGLMAIDKLGLDLFPNTSFGFVTVNTVYPGASPTEVERSVTDKIEEAVSSINGIDKVTSTSRFSFSQVFIQFELDVDERKAADEVAEKVNAIRPLLPEDAEDPAVLRLDPTAIPILTFAAESSELDPSALRDYIDDVVRPAFEKVDGVATVAILGTTEREAHIDVDREKLQRAGVTLTQLAQKIGSESLDVPSGRLETPLRETGIKAEGRPKTLDDLRNTVITALPNGGLLRLSDVATVSMGIEEQRELARVNGKPALTFTVQKAGGANTVEVTKGILAAKAKLQGEKGLPHGVKITEVFQTAQFITLNVDHLWEHLIVGGLSAILIIFLFMLDWRSTLISSFALPISVIATFFFMWQLGFTLNIMSMLGLTLAVGILIDDSVVVRENIYRHLEMGKSPKEAASQGTKEIALAVMATTFTILAVFIPIAFTGGMVGKFFKEFGLTVAISVIISMFVSLTLDPMLSTKITQKFEHDHHEKRKKMFFIGPMTRFYEGMDRFYSGIVHWTMKHRLATFGIAMGITMVSFNLAGLMGQDFAPRGDRGEFTLAVEMPAGTALTRSTEVAARVEQILMNRDEFKGAGDKGVVATRVGVNEEVEKIQFRVTYSKRTERTILLKDVLEELRVSLNDIPGITFYMREAGLGDGSFDEAPVTIFVTGVDNDKLGAYANELLSIVKTVPGVRDASSTYRPGALENRVHVDRRLAADRGVSSQEIAMTLRFALEGQEVAKMVQGEDEIPVRLRLRDADQDLASLQKLQVSAMGPNRAPVELGQVTGVDDATTPASIKRLDRTRLVTITGNLYGRTLGEVMPDINWKVLTQVTLPNWIAEWQGQGNRLEGYGFRFGGEAERLQETNENMGLALMLAVLFIYLVLASQFESFIHPFTIMLALPFAIVGANVALFITGQDQSLSSMIGSILLMGLVTKNSILLVDYANHKREEEGMAIKDAIILAGTTRLRPILMTSAAIVLGMLPAAVSKGEGSEFYAPMSIGVIGGVISSTVLTLIVVPIFYVWMDRLTIRGRREWRAEKAQRKAAKQAAKNKVKGLGPVDDAVPAVSREAV